MWGNSINNHFYCNDDRIIVWLNGQFSEVPKLKLPEAICWSSSFPGGFFFAGWFLFHFSHLLPHPVTWPTCYLFSWLFYLSEQTISQENLSSNLHKSSKLIADAHHHRSGLLHFLPLLPAGFSSVQRPKTSTTSTCFFFFLNRLHS